MSDFMKALGLAALIALAPMAMAQDATDAPADGTSDSEAPADGAAAQETPPAAGPNPNDLSLGEDLSSEGVGSSYVSEEHGDWSVRCVRAATGSDPCQLYQLLSDTDGNSVAEISIFGLPAGQQAAAGATVLTPLETLLTAQLTLTVDGGTAKRYPYTVCVPTGCLARIGFTGADIAAFKSGSSATLTIVPALAPDEEVALKVSLSGFTAGFAAVEAANAQ